MLLQRTEPTEGAALLLLLETLAASAAKNPGAQAPHAAGAARAAGAAPAALRRCCGDAGHCPFPFSGISKCLLPNTAPALRSCCGSNKQKPADREARANSLNCCCSCYCNPLYGGRGTFLLSLQQNRSISNSCCCRLAAAADVRYPFLSCIRTTEG